MFGSKHTHCRKQSFWNKKCLEKCNNSTKSVLRCCGKAGDGQWRNDSLKSPSGRRGGSRWGGIHERSRWAGSCARDLLLSRVSPRAGSSPCCVLTWWACISLMFFILFYFFLISRCLSLLSSPTPCSSPPHLCLFWSLFLESLPIVFPILVKANPRFTHRSV